MSKGQDEDIRVMSKPTDTFALHHTSKKKNKTSTVLSDVEVVKESSPLSIIHIPTSGTADQPPLVFFTLLGSKEVVTVKLTFNGINRSPRGRDLEEHPSLGVQYPGELCSTCLANSSSIAAIWQESLKAITDRQITAEKK